jgi:hypothetical protein
LPTTPDTTAPSTNQPNTANADTDIAGERGPATGTGSTALASSSMIGDIGGLGVPSIANGAPGSPNYPPRPGQLPEGRLSLPSIRSFKISENENPEPQDRVSFGFNYFNNVNDRVDSELGSDLHHIAVYRETFAFEKTFLEGNVSAGLRLPLNTLSADSTVPGLAGQSTDVGDLAIILKALLWRDLESGSVLSTGMLISTPTGPNSFAGYPFVVGYHEATLEPFIGYRWVSGNFYLHGFSSIDVPTDERDVTMMYNDIGIGYYVLRDRDNARTLTAIAPTFEVHVNTPLNHRDPLNVSDLAGTADSVDLTLGVHFEFSHRATFTVAAVEPVTGPKPFDIEAIAYLNITFGASGTGIR